MPTPTAQRAREKPTPYEVAKALLSEVERRRGEFAFNVHAGENLIIVSGKRLRGLAGELGLPWSPPVMLYFLAEAQIRGWRLVAVLGRSRKRRRWVFALPPNQAQRAVGGDAVTAGG